jgi:hypothetical protein
MCDALTNVALPNNLATIPKSTFEGCSSLASFNIPSTITNIEELAFAESGLVSVTIPDTVTSLGVGVFDYCDKLVSVTVPGSIAVITNAMFAECSRLTSVTLGEGLRYIGNSAFDNCSSLWSITIPSTVTNLQSWAFGDCTALTSVYFRGNPPVAGINTFISDDNVTVYYLPGNTNWGALYAGRRAKVWDPHVQTSGSTFGVRTNCFGFTIAATNASMVVVEACTNLANPIWLPVRTNLLVGGAAYFSDPRWTNYPTRHYRLRSW